MTWFIPIYIVCAIGGEELCIPVTLEPVEKHADCVAVLNALDSRALSAFPDSYIHTLKCDPTFRI